MRTNNNLKETMNRIMKKKIKRNLAVGAGVVLVLAASLGWSLSGKGTEAETAEAVRGDIQKYVEEVGEVKCKDSTTVFLEGSGLIKAIAVEEGQQVKTGDLLMYMDQEQMNLALQDAEEVLRGARAQLVAGDETYRTALKDYNNTKFLAEEGAASQWELTQKEAALKSAEAVRSAYRAELEQAQLNVDNSSLSLSKQQILSPIDGTVLEKNVKINELGTPGTAAFVIGNFDDVEIESKILADDVMDIRVGNKAEIKTRTDEEQPEEGIVTEIAPTATDEISSLGVKQKKVAVTVKPLAASGSLILGSEVDIRVITETKKAVIVVPTGAVFDYQGGSCVFTVEGGKAVLKKVKLGIRNESLVEITGGLKAGETVLSAPNNSNEEGMRIKAI
jgi:HlyD family secretion protein